MNARGYDSPSQTVAIKGTLTVLKSTNPESDASGSRN